MASLLTSREAIVLYIALSAVLFVEAIYLFAANLFTGRREINRRMKLQQQGLSGEEAMIRLKRERGVAGDMDQAGWLTTLLVQSGTRMGVEQLMLADMAVGALAFVVLHYALRLSLLVSLPLALALGLLLPLQYLRIKRARRARQFSGQLADALEVIVRSLRSGHPVAVSLGMVGKEMEDPIGTEFGLVVDEMTYGSDLPRSMKNLGARVGVPDLALLITAVSLQSTSGGNLAEVLGNLAKVLRDRYQLQRKVRSLSAEGRMSGWALAFMPFVLAAVIGFQSPRYYGDVWNEPTFVPVLVGLAIWSVIGDFIMYKMINFKF
ncbi:MAG: type II secretion system F family protein [Alphaproteobacteria bacterium]|nr:type II secretion system F family protein [Alphaproteobacteria bacterium]